MKLFVVIDSADRLVGLYFPSERACVKTLAGPGGKVYAAEMTKNTFDRLIDGEDWKATLLGQRETKLV